MKIITSLMILSLKNDRVNSLGTSKVSRLSSLLSSRNLHAHSNSHFACVHARHPSSHLIIPCKGGFLNVQECPEDRTKSSLPPNLFFTRRAFVLSLVDISFSRFSLDLLDFSLFSSFSFSRPFPSLPISAELRRALAQSSELQNIFTILAKFNGDGK